jgi:hypothetical protein
MISVVPYLHTTWRDYFVLKKLRLADEMPKLGVFWDVAVVLMMEAVRISATSVHFNATTRRYIPEDSKLHTRRRENLQSHTDEMSALRAKYG